ncbi:MAG TPA: hypothetical protein VN838_12075 [Bradyrhizobium sp.]|nr:hypothetical protein [Bradyrhizobium sp.]
MVSEIGRFKAGDRVICRSDVDAPLLTPGREYRIESSEDRFVVVIRDDGQARTFFEDRFDLAPEARGLQNAKPFKAGDAVVCVDTSGSSGKLTLGDQYIVNEVWKERGGWIVSVVSIFGGAPITCRADRFRLDEPEPLQDEDAVGVDTADPDPRDLTILLRVTTVDGAPFGRMVATTDDEIDITQAELVRAAAVLRMMADRMDPPEQQALPTVLAEPDVAAIVRPEAVAVPAGMVGADACDDPECMICRAYAEGPI